ncbi:MAG TPA: PilZ domain-containing protein [Terriglobales bacterium]|nr:PilZ domain-containing protein [Terriglobales bacterium]
MTRERRQNHRVLNQQVVSLVLPNTNNEDECTAIAQNVSVDGAFLVCDRHITPGSRLDASLVLPAEVTLTESKRVCCEIRVLRVIEELPDGNFLTAVEFEQYRLP